MPPRQNVFASIPGEMAERVRGFDWASTPLGPLAQWPQSLKTAAVIVLLSPVPMVMLWGEEGIMIYNDAYSAFAGRRDPMLLGSKVREGWPEVADFNDNVMKVGLSGGTLAYRDQEFTLDRTGRPERVWMNLDYSPILDEDGEPAGVLAIVMETTDRVLAERASNQQIERERRMFLQAPSFMAHLEGPDHVFAFANDAYIRLIGSRDILGKSAREALPEVTGQGFFELLDRVYATGEPYVGRSVRVLLRQARGEPEEERLLDFIYQPLRDPGGNVTGIFVDGYDVTEVRRTEIALRRSEERLRLATENAEVGLWDIDADHNISFYYAGDAFSFPRDRKISFEEFLAHVEPAEVPALRESYAAARDPDRRGVFEVEYRTIALAGALPRWVSVKGRGIFDGRGRCMRMSGTAIEISKRKEAELALRQHEEQLRLATEHAEIGLWDVDNLTNTLYWPPRVKRMFGISPEAPVTLEDFYQGLHPEDRERVAAAFAAANDPEERALYDVEYRTIGKQDGVVRWVHAKGRGLFNESGRCVRVIGTAIDVTGQKQIAEALRNSEQTLRLATDSAEIGLWDMDVVNQRNYPDARVKAMFGLPPEAEAEPEDYFAQVHPDDVENVLSAYGSAFDPEKRSVYDVEYRVLGKDAITRWIAAKGRGIFDANGKCVRVVGTAIDITARKEAEQQIRELNETLEHRVAERTAALEKSEAQIRKAEQALQQAQKMEAIGNLTGGIAHDFNNLLQGVTGSLDLIRRKPEDIDRVRRWAEAGLQAAERGAKLTAQLLAFSRAQKLELRPVDLPALLLGVRDLLDRTIGPTVRVRFDLDPHAVTVLGDETQLELAVLNLAINARDAMTGGGDLVIATRNSAGAEAGLAPGRYVELSVADSGAGMDAEVAARAFDPVFTTKGVGKGTGLGLSQVYGMARQAGGIAQIKSEPGRGTTVSIFLPLTDAALRARARQTEDVDLPGARATILVIDDDSDVRRFLSDSLDSFGYAVLQANDGLSGLDIAASAMPDLVILDYAMPGMTGAEVAQQLRISRPGLPVIFASGYAETSALDSVGEKAVVLRKPFRVRELHEAVNGALRR